MSQGFSGRPAPSLSPRRGGDGRWILTLASDETCATEYMRAIMRLFLTALVLCCVMAQAQPGPKAPRRHPGPPPDARVATPDDAAVAIQHAYDGISLTSTFGDRPVVVGGANVSGLLSESKTAYQEALSSYQLGDYVAAREQAMTSGDLSHAAQELRMSAGDSARIPAPIAPGRPDSEESFHAARDLQNLNYRLQVMDSTLGGNKSVPAAAVSHARLLLAMSWQLEQAAQTFLSQNQQRRALHMTHAADALTHAAEHLQNRYLLAAGVIPTPPPPPPGSGLPPSPPGPRVGPRR
jgi:hypothetical protein